MYIYTRAQPPTLPPFHTHKPTQAGVDYPAPEMTSIQGGQVTLGKPRGFPSFGWDNEYGAKTMEVKVRVRVSFLVVV